MNPHECYIQEHPAPKIDVRYCSCCGSYIDPQQNLQPRKIIPVCAIGDRIRNLKEHGAFKTEEYKNLCRLVTSHVTQGSFASLATQIPGELIEIQKQYAYLENISQQITLLEHILEEDIQTVTF